MHPLDSFIISLLRIETEKPVVLTNPNVYFELCSSIELNSTDSVTTGLAVNGCGNVIIDLPDLFGGILNGTLPCCTILFFSSNC